MHECLCGSRPEEGHPVIRMLVLFAALSHSRMPLKRDVDVKAATLGTFSKLRIATITCITSVRGGKQWRSWLRLSVVFCAALINEHYTFRPT
jgi:hypothetical protein